MLLVSALKGLRDKAMPAGFSLSHEAGPSYGLPCSLAMAGDRPGDDQVAARLGALADVLGDGDQECSLPPTKVDERKLVLVKTTL